MNTEQELVWDILKHDPASITAAVQFTGNGTTTKFNSAWLYNEMSFDVTDNDLRKRVYTDYVVLGNDIIFTAAPPENSIIAIKVYVNALAKPTKK